MCLTTPVGALVIYLSPGKAFEKPVSINKIVETAIYVQDLERSEAFYRDTLGLEFESRQPERHVFLKAGKSMLLIFNPEATLEETNLPAHGTSGVAHLAFEIDPDDYERWKQTLSQHRVPVEKEVTWPNRARSIYFRDPDNHAVELVTKGNWPVAD